MISARGRSVLLLVAAGVLAVAAVVLLIAGVEVRETTGGLLVTPIRQIHLVGGALLAGTAAGVAAVLCALAAVPGARARRAEPPDDTPPVVTDGVGSAHPPEATDGEPATTASGTERTS